jgi:membrane dipeptidase
MGNITLELVRRGYTEDQIGKIWGGNFLRVFREVERWAKRNSLKDKFDWPNPDQQQRR